MSLQALHKFRSQEQVLQDHRCNRRAAKYFVYKLYEDTDGQPMRWATLRGMGELRATVERAVERGWVVLEGTSGKLLESNAALTDEGRRLARRGR